jgi:signal peptidase
VLFIYIRKGEFSTAASVKKAGKILIDILVILAILLALMTVGVRVFGIRIFTVLSGSMEPTYHTGSLIYVKETDTTALKPGDVITFLLDENTVATHRIIEVVRDADDSENIRYRTKGDANDFADGGLVHCNNVIGTPVFSVPHMGYLVSYIQSPTGIYVAVSTGILLLLLVFLSDFFKKRRKANSV